LSNNSTIYTEQEHTSDCTYRFYFDYFIGKCDSTFIIGAKLQLYIESSKFDTWENIGIFCTVNYYTLLLYYKLSDEGTVGGLDAEYIDARVGDLVRKGRGELLIENKKIHRQTSFDLTVRNYCFYLI